VIGAVVSLIVMGSLRIHIVLVNFLSVAFILECDDLFNAIFVHPNANGEKEDILKSMNAEGMRIDWFASRIYIVGLAIYTAVFILNIESLMHLFMSLVLWPFGPTPHWANFEPIGIDPYNTLLAPCDTIIFGLQLTTLCVAVIGGLFHSIYLAGASWSSLDCSARCQTMLDILITPGLIVLFWYLILLEINAYVY